MKTKLNFLMILLVILCGAHHATAQDTTAFTYQGQLHDTGTNANGACSMVFKLYDAPTSGTQIGGTILNSPTLVNGLFTVNLDFGVGAFNGAARWLEIAVQAETLTPRVQILPTPYALYATSAGQLTNSSWNAVVGNYQSYNNVFGIYASNTLVMGLSPNGVLVNGYLQANGFAIGNNTSIDSDGNGGVTLNTGNSNANLTANNLTANSLTAANGIILPTSDRNRSITTTTSGIVLDGVTVSENTGVTLPNNSGNRTLSAESQGFYMNSNLRVGGYVNATSFNNSSDRNLKEQFQPVNPADVLNRVVNLPITSWNYKQDAGTRHIGPMAQDFYAAFNVGTDEKHIATVDEDGVALAAIQGLNAKIKEKETQIDALEKRLAELEKIIKAPAQTK